MRADAQRDGHPVEYRWRLCESSVIPFLVPRHKVWLTAAVRVSCNNAANIEECKTWTKENFPAGEIPLGGKSPQKCIYSILAQTTAKHRSLVGLQ